jgi:hypothetical protein
VRKLIKECKMSNIIKIDNLNKSYEVVKGKMDDVFLNATGYDLEVE